MAELRFEWDPAKDTENQRRHRVAFAEAETVFLDEGAVLIDDPDHSESEDRFLRAPGFWVLTVVHCHRAEADVIRIISA